MKQHTESNDVQRLIKTVLDEVKDSQVNMASESAREWLAEVISTQVNKHIQNLVEDIICPPANRTETGEVRLW
jgi:gas vesicle protein